VRLRPADIARRRWWWSRTNNSESVSTNAVTHVGGYSPFLAVPLRSARGAVAAIVKDLDIGLVRESAVKRGEESFVAGVDDEQFARHELRSVVQAVLSPLSREVQAVLWRRGALLHDNRDARGRAALSARCCFVEGS
jgi:hypothetical protein